MIKKIRNFWQLHHLRILVVVLLGLSFGSTAIVLQEVNISRSLLLAEQQLGELRSLNITALIKDFTALKQKIAQYKSEGVDVSTVESQLPTIEKAIFQPDNFRDAKALIANALGTLEALKAAKLEADRLASELVANQGTVTGKVSEGETALSGVIVSLYAGSTQVVKTSSDASGHYLLNASAGTYTLSASKSGYATYKKYNVAIKAKETTTVDIAMTKATTTTTNNSGGGSTANSTYSRRTVSTSRGDFLVDIMTFNLGSGVRVYTDTANDNDCTDNCPVKSLSSYVSSLGGFAGINGTYFCPADYSSCAGKVNAFFWKVKNTRLNKMINANNGLGEIDPFISFSSSGSPTYYRQYSSASTSVFAGINSWPRLVEGGANVLNESELDSKQLNTKSNRGALAIKGQVFYAVIAKSATVPDLAAVLVGLGVDNGMNIDGGGSSAMYYNGSYKVGPGRNIPNAVVFLGG